MCQVLWLGRWCQICLHTFINYPQKLFWQSAQCPTKSRVSPPLHQNQIITNCRCTWQVRWKICNSNSAIVVEKMGAKWFVGTEPRDNTVPLWYGLDAVSPQLWEGAGKGVWHILPNVAALTYCFKYIEISVSCQSSQFRNIYWSNHNFYWGYSLCFFCT